MSRREEHGYLTCLTCGRFFGGEAPVNALGPGRVMAGGFGGRVVTCECCNGYGRHLVDHGVPKCHRVEPVEYARVWLGEHADDEHNEAYVKRRAYTARLVTWHGETDERTFAGLVDLYGPEKAEQLMALDPPL